MNPEVLKERKLAFKILFETLQSKLPKKDRIKCVLVVSNTEKRLFTACIDSKGEARDQRLRHNVVYKQMVREVLGYIHTVSPATCDVMSATSLANELAAAAVRPLSFVDEEGIQQQQLQGVQHTMKTKVACTKCGGAAVVYEKQERSSDEGATVYHQCVNKDCMFKLRLA